AVRVSYGTNIIETLTDAGGNFFLNLPTGEYQLAVTAPHLASWVRTLWVIPNMRALEISLSLEPVAHTVQVTAENAAVSVDSAFGLNSITITGDELQNLPNDQDSLLRYLQLVAGGSGTTQLVVDGFESSRI